MFIFDTMQEIPIHLDFIALIIFLGVVFGIFISYFIIKKSLKKNFSNLFMGLFILSLSLMMLEGWLNYTKYIFKYLYLSDFSEPLNFTAAPLFYLFIDSQLKHSNKKWYWMHFIPFLFWLFICSFYYLQPDWLKYNSSIDVMQFDIPKIIGTQPFSDNPLGIRPWINRLTGLSFIVYIFLGFRLLLIKSRSLGQTMLNTTNKTLVTLRNMSFHILIVSIIFVLVKSIFEHDVGDYFILMYLSLMIFITVVQVINKSTYFNEISTFLELPKLKYIKSSLAEEDKNIILEAITKKMEDEKYFLSSTASLSGLAKGINESSHHVSQVINEKLNQSFFEFLAAYRVEEAKDILRSDFGKKLTIEEVAERVGYNSKSSFNTVFKKITSVTPSQFRDS